MKTNHTFLIELIFVTIAIIWIMISKGIPDNKQDFWVSALLLGHFFLTYYQATEFYK